MLESHCLEVGERVGYTVPKALWAEAATIDFGDGSRGEARSGAHIYRRAGVFTLRLLDDSGNPLLARTNAVTVRPAGATFGLPQAREAEACFRAHAYYLQQQAKGDDAQSAGAIDRSLAQLKPARATESSRQETGEEDGGPEPLRTHADLANQLEFEKTLDPALGYVPRNRLFDAYDEMREIERNRGMEHRAAISGVTWQNMGPKNVGGRTRALLIDPNDPTGRSVFAGGVSGGLWKTTDITAAQPNWTPVDDKFNNLAIVSITADPDNPQTMYFGTGEGFFNADAVRGEGIWKSTDGGITWSQLTATQQTDWGNCPVGGAEGCDFAYVNDLVALGGGTDIVIAATRGVGGGEGGILRSTDGGTTWTRIMGARGADLEVDANGGIYAAMGIFNSNGVYKSTDNGATWTQVYTTSVEQRIEIATAPSDPSVVYLLTQAGPSGVQTTNDLEQILVSTNATNAPGSITFSQVGDPHPAWDDQCSGSSFSFTRNQAWYDLIAAVDPTDANTVYVGGVDVMKTTDGGNTWTQISTWADCDDISDMHADQHAMAVRSSDTIYFGNDGGVYATYNATSAAPDFHAKEQNYNTTQYYSVALAPTADSDVIYGGTQDNGSLKHTLFGVNDAEEVTGGDGGFAHVDQTNADNVITASTFQNIFTSTDGGESFTQIFGGGDGKFINPSDLDSDTDVLYMSDVDGGYRFFSDVFGTPGTTGVTGSFGGQVSAVSVDPNTADRVWFGTDAGEVIFYDNANTAPAENIVTGGSMPGANVSSIAIEDGDASHVLVTFSNYGVTSVWESTDAGGTWTAVEGNLPDMPIRWALFNPNDNTQALLATELGVWSTDNLNGGSTDWQPTNTGFPNVRTDMLQRRTSDNYVAAATHGRGMGSSTSFATSAAARFKANPMVVYPGQDVSFDNASRGGTSFSWDFGDGANSTQKNPTHTYTSGGRFTVQLDINGGGGALTTTRDVVVLPQKGTPFTQAAMGASWTGDFESLPDDFASSELSGGFNLWERGTPSGAGASTVTDPPPSGSNVWGTDLDNDFPDADYASALYTPTFNMTAAASPAYELSFEIAMEEAFCNLPFGVWVEYSVDSGRTWQTLGSADPADPDRLANWYEVGPNSSSGCDKLNTVSPDRVSWSFSASGYFTAAYDVSFLAGNEAVAFRFRQQTISGFSTSADGFYVDDFELDGPTNAPATGGVLPIELTDISARPEDQRHIRLNWQTATEQNNRQFVVERSADGQDFTRVGQVPGSGTTQEPRSYSFLDREPGPGRHYYRLRQVDFDGSTNVSPIVSARLNGAEGFRIGRIYPVPATDYLLIGYGSDRAVPLRIEVTSTSGKVLLEEQAEALAGEGVHYLSLRGLAAGTYLLRTTPEGGKPQTRKFVVR